MYYVLWIYLFTGFNQNIKLEQPKYVTLKECKEHKRNYDAMGYTTGECLPMEVTGASSQTTKKQEQSGEDFIKRYLSMPKVTPPVDPYAKPKQPSEAFIEGFKKEMSKPEVIEEEI